MNTFTEGESIFVGVRFLDQDGLPVVPTSLEYIVSDVTSGMELIRETITPAASRVNIQLFVDASKIINSDNEFEDRYLNYYYSYDTLVDGIASVGYGSGEQIFRIKNLFKDKT